MESGPDDLHDGAIAEELEARLRALMAEIGATDAPPALEALARRLEAALAALRADAPPPAGE